MSFSPKQQGVFRPLVEEAWANFCQHEALDPSKRCGKSKRCGDCLFCAWYRSELMDAAGVCSTTELDVKRDFENVMRHFAQIAENLYWMTRADGGDVRRLLHNVHEVCRDRDFSDAVVLGYALKALRIERADWPGWEKLTYKQVGTVLSALKSKARHFRDCKTPSVETLPTPGDREMEPF